MPDSLQTFEACGRDHSHIWRDGRGTERMRIDRIVEEAAAAGPRSGPGARMWLEATIWIARRIQND